MALRALILRKKIDDLNRKLQDNIAAADELKQREADLSQAIEEAETEDDQKFVSDAVTKYEEDKDENEKENQSLLSAIQETENELAEIEKAETAARSDENKKQDAVERKQTKMIYTNEQFFGMSEERKNAFFADEQVRGFLDAMRDIGSKKDQKQVRTVTGLDTLIPDVMIPLIRTKTEEFSKLLKYTNFKAIKGKSRTKIAGVIPEAAWTEMYTGVTQNLDMAFYADKFDGYKVDGYIAISNDYLADSDIALATEIINAIAGAIGKAIDKAIIYGADGEMPYGVVTSLLATTAPSNHPSNGRQWADYHSTHINTITSANATGVKLFQNIVLNTGVIRNDYSDANLVWVMNNATKMKILAESIGVNSGAAIVAGMGDKMPVVGGDIVTLEFIPDDTVIYGYFGNYMLVQREGVELAQSTDYHFLEDETVFRGTARYDGKPVIREAFGVIGIGKAPVTTAPAFAGQDAGGNGEGGEGGNG